MAKAEEAKKGKESEAAPEAAPKKGNKKMLIIIIAVVVLLLGGGGAAFAFMGGAKKGEAKKEEHLEPRLHLAKLDTFLVNLAEPGSFLKAAIQLEYDENILEKIAEQKASGGGKGHGGGGAEGGESTGLPPLLKVKEPMIRDAIIRVFAGKHAPEVLSPDGKDKLKEELVGAINESLGYDEAPITNLYFSEFIVQ